MELPIWLTKNELEINGDEIVFTVTKALMAALPEAIVTVREGDNEGSLRIYVREGETRALFDLDTWNVDVWLLFAEGEYRTAEERLISRIMRALVGILATD